MERRYAVYAWVIGWRRVFTRFSPDFTDRGEEGSRHAGIGITTITGSSATRKLQRQQPTANNRVRFNDRACWRMFKRALNATAWWERRFRPRGGKQIGGRRGGGSRNGSIENEQWRVSRNNRLGAPLFGSGKEFWLSWKIHDHRSKHDKRLSRSCVAFAGQFLPEFRSTATVNYRFRPHATGST